MSDFKDFMKVREIEEKLEGVRRALQFGQDFGIGENLDVLKQILTQTKEIVDQQERPIEQLLSKSTIKYLQKIAKENEMQKQKEKVEGDVSPYGMIDFQFEFYQKGKRWVTVVWITTIHFHTAWNTGLVGIAICNPADEFDPKIGRYTAIAHAIEGLTKGQCANVWEHYKRLAPTATGRLFKKDFQSEKKTSS